MGTVLKSIGSVADASAMHVARRHNAPRAPDVVSSARAARDQLFTSLSTTIEHGVASLQSDA